ncbi:putative conserved integral membrane protein [Leifsonia sp. LS1]|uniref:cation transporter n=1 Tax=Leifsonia sp. LS1 TaxID=2828483 RepID=UPI001CFE2ED0|nr:cation transporter [Leifsonia sp. LS1]GIT82168.1 putative conserved integral membrane protein [Leifsonia sp. LS1]
MTDEALRLRRSGIGLEIITLGWNVVGVVLLAMLAYQSSSVALLGFGLDSLIEIGASTVVIWELTDTNELRQQVALRLIGWAFILLAAYLLVQGVVALGLGHHATPRIGGIAWTALTAVVMFALAWGKWVVGKRLNNPVLLTEGRVTLVDGILAASVLLGILLDYTFGWWWADPIAGLVIVFYAVREAIHIFRA